MKDQKKKKLKLPAFMQERIFFFQTAREKELKLNIQKQKKKEKIQAPRERSTQIQYAKRKEI
jgi:hypothetical protein